MSDNFRKFRALLMGEVSKQIRLKTAEIPVAKVRRGRPRKGPRVLVRGDRGGEHGIAYFVGADGKKRSLGLAGNDCEAAVTAAQHAMDVEYARMLGETSPMFTPLADVFEYEKSKIAPGDKATVADHRAFQSRAMKLNRLLGFFGDGATLGDITPDACEEYGEWLLAQRARPEHQVSRSDDRGYAQDGPRLGSPGAYALGKAQAKDNHQRVRGPAASEPAPELADTLTSRQDLPIRPLGLDLG